MSKLILPFVVLLTLVQAPAFADVVVNGGGRFEELLGLRIGQRGVIFEVAGQGPGCTEKEHFHVERFGSSPFLLILIRDIPSGGTAPGICRRANVGRQKIKFSFSELGLSLGDRVDVVNQVLINDIPALETSRD